MSKQNKILLDELMRLAFIYAEQDRESYLDAISKMKGGEWDAIIAFNEQLLKQLREYRRKRWGTSANEKLMDEIKPVSLFDYLKQK